MPHRVTAFLRTPGNIAHVKRPSLSPRSTSGGSASDACVYSEQQQHHHHDPLASLKMPDFGDAIKKHHRLSLPFGRSSRDGGGSNGSGGSSTVATIDCSVESPPIIFHGNAEESTGALVSGLLFLDVKEEVEVETFHATLNLHLVHRHAFQAGCKDCRNQFIPLADWQFLAQPTTLRPGKHQYPFSVLLPGHLPSTMGTPVINTSYEFNAEAMVMRTAVLGPSIPVKFERTFHVKRSVPEPELPHHSVRVFPPTNIKASAHYSGVIHPTASNKLTLKVDGLVTHYPNSKMMEMWRLNKVTWKLEETIKGNAPSCEKHACPSAEDGKSTVPRGEVRVIGEEHLHRGWKSHYEGADGSIEMEFDFGVTEYKPYSRELKYACDFKSADPSIEVSHSLLVEMIVAKETAPEGKAQLATQTGTGRILRMHFAVTLTDYPGLGVSWDNESPPVYQDVPPSPPAYACDECPAEYESLEPLYAHRSSFEPEGESGNGS